MHTDLIEKIIARRLRTLADEPAEAPYDWAVFQRRQADRPRASRSIGRNRPAAVAIASAAAALAAGFVIASVTHRRTLLSKPAPTLTPAAVARLDSGGSVTSRAMPQAQPSMTPQERPNAMRQVQANAVSPVQPERQTQQRTRAVEAWLANLPPQHAIIRVGEHAAVSSLQDQIAALDDLMSAERVAGAQPTRLGALEQQRAQLVSSLAQLRYAEMLASATP